MNKPEQFSLLDPAVQQCPFEYYRVLREEAPVYLMPETGMFIVTAYDLLMEVMKNPKVFSNLAPGGRRAGLYCEAAERIVDEKGYGRFMPTIVNNDPPGHTVYRGLVNDAFRAGRIRKMEDYIADVVADLIGRFADRGECDAVADFAVPVPMYVIADQLGVPREDFQKFKEWSDAWVAGLGMPVPDEVLIDAAEKVVEMQHYMIARMHERREAPQDDIMSDLVQATYEGRPLEDKEILSIVEQILVAGNETTTNGIANGIQRMAEDQGLQARLREDRGLLPKFVEEVLRSDSPVQGLFRYTTEDSELGGVRIPKGSTVMIRYAAGNRDGAKFEEPEDFDIGRKNNGAHIAFGSGIHHCVGSQLARAEMLASFRAFLDRFAGFDLAIPAGDIRYHPSFALRGPVTLPLRLTPAAVG
jgi:cytochrome P450